MNSADTTQSRTVSADIRFSHAVKVLFFAAKNTTNPAVHSNYTTGLPVLKPMDENVCKTDTSSTNDCKVTQVNTLRLACCNAKDPLQRANLVYENTQRLSYMTMDYYNQVQPYYHAPSMPHNHPGASTWCQESVHMYSYSLDFMCLDPLGSTNFGKLTNVQLNVQTTADLSMGGVNASNSNSGQQAIVTTLGATNNYAVAGTKNGDNYNSVDVSYQLMLTAINNNIVRISGGALGFPVL